MEKFLLKTFIVVCVIMLSAIRPSFAGIEPYEDFISGSIKQNDTVIVNDEKFKNPLFDWADITNISVKNIISLRILDNQPISQSFSCTAVLRVEYYTTPGQGVPTVIDQVNLSVNYSKAGGAKYKISDSYNFANGHYVKITVLNITSPEFGTSIPPVLELSSKIVVDRQYHFKPGTTIKAQETLSSSGLNLSWPLIAGAEEYDVEWTTADTGSIHWSTVQDMKAGTSLPVHALDGLFRNNATRISTPKNNYLVSNVFNADYLLVRVRQVQYKDSLRFEGNWDYRLADNRYMLWSLGWHESNKNWQYSAVYAEEGKKKETITYFDGSLRGRQTATINSSDNVAIVQENIYDEFGRQAASILPAPAKQGSGTQFLHYFRRFNLDSLGRPYSNLSFNPLDCEISPWSLLADSGASRYYSPNNPFIAAKNYNRYIPDAGGYPLSLTHYTADNTGRIKIQGGVGQMFQPGQNNGRKTTRYYYGKPEQWELDRLFGNDVGYANRYLKNMVVDPNGQISISYLNASGKTIATALTGVAPGNVDSLDNLPPPTTEEARIIRPEQFVFNSTALKLSATTTYLASVAGNASIKYSIDKLINKQTAGSFEVCSNCYYDLRVSITDDCNESVFSATEPVKIGSELANCEDEGIHFDTLDVQLPKIGEYQISFEFQLSRPVVEEYTTEFIRKGQEHGSIKREFAFIKQYLDSLDLSSNFGDCRTCKDELGIKEIFTSRMTDIILQLEVDSMSVASTEFQSWIGNKYEELMANCRSLEASCLLAPACQENEMLMREDVSPGGQFSLFDAEGDVLEPQLNVLYNYWRIEFPVSSPGSAAYESELITLEDSTAVTSPYSASFTLPMLLKYWKEDWAVRFLKYHPEYCKLQFCGLNATSLNWDKRLTQNIKTVADIAYIPGGQGLQYQRDNGAWLLTADPFFKTGGLGASYFTAMQQDLTSYSQLVMGLNVAGADVKSLTKVVDYMTYCISLNNTTNSGSDSWNNCTPIENCRIPDREWQLYLEKYLELKEKYYGIVRDNTTCAAACITGTPIDMKKQFESMTAADFTISGDGKGTCGPLEKQLLVSYMKGKVSQRVAVELYYPKMTNPLIVFIPAGESSKSVCVLWKLPLSSFKILSVNTVSALE